MAFPTDIGIIDLMLDIPTGDQRDWYEFLKPQLREESREYEFPVQYMFHDVPHVDGGPRICELVEYYLEDIQIKGAWTGPATLKLEPHALAPIAELPVREVLSATHIVADLTLGLGKVVYDYLKA